MEEAKIVFMIALAFFRSNQPRFPKNMIYAKYNKINTLKKNEVVKFFIQVCQTLSLVGDCSKSDFSVPPGILAMTAAVFV